MAEKQKPPTLDENSPLHKGSLWLWIPVLSSAILGAVLSQALVKLLGC